MELPNENNLTNKEANARVVYADEDDPSSYPTLLNHTFREILHLARRLPPSVNGKTSLAHITGDDTLLNISNWDETMDGYDNWGVHVKTGGGSNWMRKSRTQLMYRGAFGGNSTDLAYEPFEQVHRMMAAYHERTLKEYSHTKEFQDGESQLYVLLIQLHPSHHKNTATTKEHTHRNKVWRLVTCHADTNLDSFHDQIIAPAMGWRRHYHGYKFIIPTSGVAFGPQNSDAIDMMHSDGYTFDSENYDLRHVLRKPKQRIHYIYDLGDAWRHDVTLIGRVDRRTTIGLEFFDQYKFVQDALRGNDRREWSLEVNTNKLIAGAINCPPEDSNGCDDFGDYGSILKRGHNYQPNEFGVNWKEHDISNAFDFDLDDHQERFDEATSQRKNPSDGCMQYMTSFDGSPADFRRMGGKHRKHSGHGAQSEVLGKKHTSKKCANCLKQQHSNAGLKLFSCSRCKTVSYCGKQCQIEHWKRSHKHTCNK